jgi:hypothetical protein
MPGGGGGRQGFLGEQGVTAGSLKEDGRALGVSALVLLSGASLTGRLVANGSLMRQAASDQIADGPQGMSALGFCIMSKSKTV